MDWTSSFVNFREVKEKGCALLESDMQNTST